MKKRILSLVMALALAVGLLPVGAVATGMDTGNSPTSVTVNFTAQAEGEFLCAPQFNVEVKSDLAESYGYTDSVENGVSALDVLVKAHEVVFVGAFTTETAKGFLETTGTTQKAFGEEGYLGFVLNGMYPHDGTESSWGGYSGTTVNTQEVADNDLVELFLYSSTWNDTLAWFNQNGSAVEQISAKPDANVTLTLKGISYMYGYLYADANALHAAGNAIANARLAWMDISSGSLNKIDGAVTNTSGEVTLTLPDEEGIYYLTAYIPEDNIADGASPLILSLTPVTVNTNAPEEPQFGPCDLTALSVADLNSNPNALTLSPAFSPDVTVYSVGTVPFQQYAKLAYVKATAASNTATITAELNGTTKSVTSGNSSWEMFNNMLPGQDNTLTITVTNGTDSKAYTVTIPMAADPNAPHLKGDATTTATVTLDTPYTLDLSTVFADADPADLTYTVKVDDTDPVTAEASYHFQPTEPGTYTLVFSASDGTNTSPTYTVTLHVVTAAEHVMHNIAAKYAQSGIADDGNYPWLAAEMTVYAQLFPDTKNKLTQNQIQATLDKLISDASTTSSPGTLAKDIIALRALGYDARKAVTETNTELDVVKKLTDLVDDQSNSVSNIYTLPYVIIALQQGTDYATQAQMDWLLQTAVDTKNSWQNTQWGPDGATPMVLALAPYCNSNAEIKTAVNEALIAIQGTQREDGSLGNAASTGLGMAAYAALGQTGPVKDGKTLTDGLMTMVSDTLDGFNPTTNSFNTEQGFRGLVAAEKNSRVFDFDEMPMETARATLTAGCPVEFHVVPDSATVEVKKGEEVEAPTSGTKYYLTAGDYTYTVSKTGYLSESGVFTVSADDAEKHTAKTLPVSLAMQPAPETKDISVYVRVLTHDEEACEGKYTYKYNRSTYNTVLAEETVTLKAGQTVFEALQKTLTTDNITYSEKSSGYIDSIGGISEFDHDSANSGWMYMVNGSVEKIGCRDHVLKSNATIVWFFTDDYTKEYGSENWGGTVTDPADQKAANTVKDLIAALGTINADSGDAIQAAREAYDKLTNAQKKLVENYDVLTKAEAAYAALSSPLPFTDVDGHWAREAIQYAYEKDLMNGVNDTDFAPNKTLNRAMLATILYRMEGSPSVTAANSYSDVAADTWYADAVIWASENGIVNGYGNGKFGPTDNITREQLATMLLRYSDYKAYDTDARSHLTGYTDTSSISAWALESVQWANGEGLVTGRTETTIVPKGSTTRAETATILMRYLEKAAG